MQPASARATRPVTNDDLERLGSGYKDLEYLLANWNKATRKCEKNMDKRVGQLQSGQASPDLCEAMPDRVRDYLGMRNTKHKLFNTKQLFIDIEAAGMIPSGEEDTFQDAIEDFERYQREADEWAYTSAWAEAQPGGGRDNKEDYLLRAQKDVELATKQLRTICTILKLI